MKLTKFKFELPNEKIAQNPIPSRHESKLMVLNRKEQTIEHKRFDDILDMFDEDDLFIRNNTKVFPARLEGNKEKTGAEIEVFLLRELNSEYRLWDVLVDPARKIRVGNKLYFGEDDMVAEVIDNTTSRGRTIRFLYDGTDAEFKEIIYRIGSTPLPKYIDREVRDEDEMARIVFKQKKTEGMEYLYISNQARELLGERAGSSERVFTGLKYGAQYNTEILRWCMRAGITKHITFHSARHTNAVLLLENGADIYTVSKRLGHKELRTTEIYAKIIDTKMKEAANSIPVLKFS